MSAILNGIVELLYGAIEGVATGLGSGLSALVKAIFLTGEGTSASPYELSIFGGMIVIFGAIGLAVGLSRFIVEWLTTWGK